MAELAQVFDLRQFEQGKLQNLLSWEVLYICLSGANRGKFAAMSFAADHMMLLFAFMMRLAT